MGRIMGYTEFVAESLSNEYYYTTSHPMPMGEFIEIEVEDRQNYDIGDVEEWMSKYGIDMDDMVLWVALEPHVAARYGMPSGDWDRCKEIYEADPDAYDVEAVKSSDGVLIPESDDGDDGFLFLYR